MIQINGIRYKLTDIFSIKLDIGTGVLIYGIRRFFRWEISHCYLLSFVLTSLLVPDLYDYIVKLKHQVEWKLWNVWYKQVEKNVRNKKFVPTDFYSLWSLTLNCSYVPSFVEYVRFPKWIRLLRVCDKFEVMW